MTIPFPPAPIRVLVVDDQELVRSGFCVILDAADGITVVGEAANGEAAVAVAAVHHPDVVLMDIRMPGMDGLEATRLLTGGSPAPKVVMLTTFDLDEYVYEALRAGAVSGGRRANASMRRRVTDGASMASPAAAARTAAMRSARGESLSRNPLAPARSAS